MQINRNNSIITTIPIAEIPETERSNPPSYFLIDGVKAMLDSYDDSSVTLLEWDGCFSSDEHDIDNWSSMVVNFTEDGIFDIKAVWEE